MPNPNIFVDDSPIHGKGLFARTFIPAGEEIGSIEGEYTANDSDHVLWLDEQTGIRVEDTHLTKSLRNHSLIRPSSDV